jgi:hypothetical protein
VTWPRILPALAIFGLFSCAPLPLLKPTSHHTVQRALEAGFSQQYLPGYPGLVLVHPGALPKEGSSSGSDLRIIVFIEGDGAPWSGSGYRPPSDPTPRNSIVLKLAVQEVHLRSEGSQKQRSRPVVVAYLSRPCQFEPNHALCSPELWTSDRYGNLVLDLMNEAIGQVIYSSLSLLSRENIQITLVSVHLIGHSGGGTVAALLAGSSREVNCLVTLAAPLDLAAWTSRQNLSPLVGSIDPALDPKKLAKTQSHHFLGQDDTLVDLSALGVFAARQPGRTVDLLAGVSHTAGWERNWNAIRTKTCLTAE